MKTIFPPPPIKKAREVRIRATNVDGRLAALEEVTATLRFWVSLALTLTAMFFTASLIALAWWYSKGGA